MKICESKGSLINTIISSSQRVVLSHNLRSRLLQTSSSLRTRSTTNSISASLRQHAQPHSSTSETIPSFLSDIPLSLRLSFGTETSCTVHSHQRSTHMIGDKGSVSSLSAKSNADYLNYTLDKNSRPPTSDLCHYPLRLDY